MTQIWRMVRIFISSTFRDMHAERDYLVRVVFPELRERCAKRHLHLIDVDLRWGVTEKEVEQGKVLEIILDEIDRSRPFFVAMLGERYGSVLNKDKIPEDTTFRYPWLKDYLEHSLTALEIIYGVLRNPDLAKRSFFYFRDPKIISQIPEDKRSDFKAESPDSERKLMKLKEEIRKSGRPVMENYPCSWDKDKGCITGLEVFGNQVLEDLWEAICAEYPEAIPKIDPLEMEREMHEAFVAERSHLHIGREKEAERLTAYIQGIDRRPVVITGESGSGKSAFLASWYRQYTEKYPNDYVLAYFIGASPDSTNHFRLLRNMCKELKKRFNLKEEIPDENKKLSDTLGEMLFSASKTKRRIVILVDGLDQLLPLETAHSLGWLLDFIPEKVRLVVSSLEGDCLEVLRWRSAEEIVLPPLSKEEQFQIVEKVLEKWSRRLDEKQMSALLAHPDVKNPLYLRVALEELRLFGKFEPLTKRIESLAPDIPGMFEQVLERLEGDYGKELVKEVFSLLGSSRYGLTENEILDLSRRDGEEKLPQVLWLRLYRGAKSYLVKRGEFINFFHRELFGAVEKRYLSQEKKHKKLAEYFAKAPIERKLDEYPYQLQKGEEWELLAKTLSELDFFQYAWEQNREYEWIGYWLSLKGKFEPKEFYETAIKEKEEREGCSQSIAKFYYYASRLLELMGYYKSALAFRENAYSIFEENIGYNNPSLAPYIDSLACLNMLLGDYEKARKLNRIALNMHKKKVKTNDFETAIYLENMAVIFKEKGEISKAISLTKRALCIIESLKRLNHPEVATILSNLSSMYIAIGNFKKAIVLSTRALQIEENRKGLYHPDVGFCLINLGSAYMHIGNYPLAHSCFERALAILEKYFGTDHPNIADVYTNLGLCYQKEENYELALYFLQKALSINEKFTGKTHPTIAYILFSMAGCYAMLNQLMEATHCCKCAVLIAQKVFGAEDSQTQMYKERLAVIEEKQNTQGRGKSNLNE
ncbi:MAG: tetratricopeptide repeat protein [candidate division WOR-3 bacterium]